MKNCEYMIGFIHFYGTQQTILSNLEKWTNRTKQILLSWHCVGLKRKISCYTNNNQNNSIKSKTKIKNKKS